MESSFDFAARHYKRIPLLVMQTVAIPANQCALLNLKAIARLEYQLTVCLTKTKGGPEKAAPCCNTGSASFPVWMFGRLNSSVLSLPSAPCRETLTLEPAVGLVPPLARIACVRVSPA